MSRLAFVVLAACSAPKPAHVDPPRPAPADAAPVAINAAAIGAPVVHTSPPRAMIEAPHGGTILTVAVTADGLAAISCDDQGGLRLWPTLDGSREPRVVDLPMPRELAIGRQGQGFEVVLLDDVGGLVIASLDPDGRTLKHLSLAGDPAFVGVAMTELGPLGWRSDQTVVQLGHDGVMLGALAVEPGQRIANVVVAGEHAVAVIEAIAGGDVIGADAAAVTTTRARWLKLDRVPSWGAWIDAGRELGPLVALSASGKRLAVLMHPVTSPLVPQVVVIDTATGVMVGDVVGRPAIAIGFFDDAHLAVGAIGGVTAVEIGNVATPPEPAKLEPTVRPAQNLGIGIAGGRAVLAREGELMIVTPTETRYLGYELESPSVAATAPHGGLVIGLNETFALLDTSLHVVATPDVLAAKDARVAELHWLGGDDWLVEASSQTDGSTSLSLIDIASRKVSVLRSAVPVVQLMLYEPSTHLVTLSLGEAPLIDRYDPTGHRLAQLATLAKPNGFEQRELAPVAPALADGAQLVSIQMRDRMTLRWIADLAALDKGPSITVDGSLAGVDAAGHVYVWEAALPPAPLKLAVFSGGKRVGTLPADGMVALWPDPKGTRVVETGGSDVTLVGLDGMKRWSIPIQSATEALWLDDGGLALVSAAGLARIDPETGAIMAARCGWRFGLATKPHPTTPRVEPVCVQQLGK